jgi:hypothetical protein
LLFYFWDLDGLGFCSVVVVLFLDHVTVLLAFLTVFGEFEDFWWVAGAEELGGVNGGFWEGVCGVFVVALTVIVF